MDCETAGWYSTIETVDVVNPLLGGSGGSEELETLEPPKPERGRARRLAGVFEHNDETKLSLLTLTWLYHGCW